MTAVSSFQLSFATFALAGAATLGTSSVLGLTGCGGDEFTVGPAGDGGSEGSGGGDGGSDGGGGPVFGTQYIPQGVRPTLGQTLPAKYAYLQWSVPSAIPEGKTIDHYDVCWATGTVIDLGDETECPNGLSTINTYSAVDSLLASGQYFWKVRTAFKDGTTSYYSSALPFRTDNRLAVWTRANETSGTTAADTSGNGNAGNLKNGASFVTGLFGNAMQYDGTDDYADLGNDGSVQLEGPLTVSLWVNANGIPTASDSGLLNLGMLNYALTYHTNGSVYFYIGNGGNSLHAPMTPNAWHHVVGTFDGTTVPGGMNLYVDGLSVSSKASTTDMTGAADNLWLGRYNTSYFRGLLDEASVYADFMDADGVINDFCAVHVLAGTEPLPNPCL